MGESLISGGSVMDYNQFPNGVGLKLFRVFFKGRDHFFQVKRHAKEFGRKHGLKGAVVHRGPDHWRGPS